LSLLIVKRSEIKAEMNVLEGKIKGKDLKNVAAVKHESLKHLVAFDKDYEQVGVKEYITPKGFVKLFNHMIKSTKDAWMLTQHVTCWKELSSVEVNVFAYIGIPMMTVASGQ